MTLPQVIRIGTRQSMLALAQTHFVRNKLSSLFPESTFDVVPIVTTGDRITNQSLADIGGKGLFTKELEEQLLNRSIDFAVHSLKDMETHLHHEMIIAAVCEREDPHDALLSRSKLPLMQLPQGAIVGTSSVRRTAQLNAKRPDLTVIPLRGNITTRLAKLNEGEVDAILLAVAGLKRIGCEQEITEILDAEHFVPAAGQGIIAIECLSTNETIRDMLSVLNHQPSWLAMTAERAVLATLDGSCKTPIGAYATINGTTLSIRAMLAKMDGSSCFYSYRSGTTDNAAKLGIELAHELLRQNS